MDRLAEAARLEVLCDYEILDTPPDGAFDRVTALAAQVFETPIALVSLVDEDRIWFKSRHGLDAPEIAREPGLCASATFAVGAYVVRDAAIDPRTLTNSLVVGEMGLRFYAAAPLITRGGARLGTFNVIDFAPRDFTPSDEAMLEDFAAIVMDQMEVRLSGRKLADTLTYLVRQNRSIARDEEFLKVCAWSKQVQVKGAWMSFDQFLSDVLGRKVTHGLAPGVEID